ncbi:GIY-YIG nuclease family protein [Anabaena azotica FACHB-119]|uniref:GIY-YIG nuclease family protein n=2 Tax=Anabaena azotica TaxID=197653 RepID=A0ABR8DED6_9NOST|nr:GIY-YIG nuclease family protein [Anabaena azotica FACHB-119]
MPYHDSGRIQPKPLEPQQLNLFANNTITPSYGSKADTLLMSADVLQEWKSRILTHQQRVRANQSPQQATLFDLTPTHCDPEAIDPLTLQLVPMSFYCTPADSPGEACLYFIIDSAAGLVLYVGETMRSNKRWKGIHDCKDYIASYQDLHYKYGLPKAVNAAFWWDAPVERRARQQLELSLIVKWRSPFNKENWDLWGQPFK